MTMPHTPETRTIVAETLREVANCAALAHLSHEAYPVALQQELRLFADSLDAQVARSRASEIERASSQVGGLGCVHNLIRIHNDNEWPKICVKCGHKQAQPAPAVLGVEGGEAGRVLPKETRQADVASAATCGNIPQDGAPPSVSPSTGDDPLNDTRNPNVRVRPLLDSLGATAEGKMEACPKCGTTPCRRLPPQPVEVAEASKLRGSVDALSAARSENHYTDLKTTNFGVQWAEAVEGGDFDKICRAGDKLAAALTQMQGEIERHSQGELGYLDYIKMLGVRLANEEARATALQQVVDAAKELGDAGNDICLSDYEPAGFTADENGATHAHCHIVKVLAKSQHLGRFEIAHKAFEKALAATPPLPDKE